MTIDDSESASKEFNSDYKDKKWIWNSYVNFWKNMLL